MKKYLLVALVCCLPVLGKGFEKTWEAVLDQQNPAIGKCAGSPNHIDIDSIGSVYVLYGKCLIKVSTKGELLWVERLSQPSYSYYKVMKVGPKGGIFAGRGRFIDKFSPNGTLQWTYKLRYGLRFSDGLKVDDNGNGYVVTLQRFNCKSLKKGKSCKYRVHLTKLDGQTGRQVYSFYVGASRINYAVDSAGVVTAQYYSRQTQQVIRLSPTGERLWGASGSYLVTVSKNGRHIILLGEVFGTHYQFEPGQGKPISKEQFFRNGHGSIFWSHVTDQGNFFLGYTHFKHQGKTHSFFEAFSHTNQLLYRTGFSKARENVYADQKDGRLYTVRNREHKIGAVLSYDLNGKLEREFHIKEPKNWIDVEGFVLGSERDVYVLVEKNHKTASILRLDPSR